jgi:hypothetical protein
MQRSEIREKTRAAPTPDYASLHPGYGISPDRDGAGYPYRIHLTKVGF